MQTQQDHVEAQSFLVGRMTAALITGDARYLEAPARRTWTGIVIGIVLAVFIIAGFAIFGLVAGHKSGSTTGPAGPGTATHATTHAETTPRPTP